MIFKLKKGKYLSDQSKQFKLKIFHSVWSGFLPLAYKTSSAEHGVASDNHKKMAF
jgi:hypothetical protein